MAEGLDAVWASGLSSQASSALSSSSSQHTGPGTQQWALLGVFGALCVAVLAVFVLKLVRQHVCPPRAPTPMHTHATQRE